MTKKGRKNSIKPELTPVREAHRIDGAALTRYLRDHLDGDFEDLSLLQYEGGQSNPTYRVSANGRYYVLRKKPPGVLLRSAHAIERECRVMTALRDTGVPVPDIYLLCEDDTIIGTPFFVMEHVAGRVATDIGLPTFSKPERAAFYEHFIEVLAALHRVDYEAVGLGDYGRPGSYYERQFSRWSKQYRASETSTIPAMESLIEWLPKHLPDGDESTIAHGDYRIPNCIIHPTEARVVALLDWELSTIGHPLSDAGYACMFDLIRFEDEEPIEHEAMGIPTRDQFFERYCAVAGRAPVEDPTFYVVFNLFRLSAISQGVYKRGLEGIASSDLWEERGTKARMVAEAGWQLVQG